MTSMLIVGDPHASPYFDNKRFTWLGRYIADTRPDIVHCTGDFADLPSLSRHDRGKLSFEGRRYEKDVEAVHEALGLVHAEVKRLRKRPMFHMNAGNHEERIKKFVQDHAELAGNMSIADLGYEDYGWEVTPFLEVRELCGFATCHYMQQKNTDRAMGGENIGRALIQKGYQSAIVGHSHLRVEATDVRWDGTRLHGISAGCFTHHNFVEDWSKQSAKLAWRGVIRLDNCANGTYDSAQYISLAQLKRAYGGQ